MKDKKIFSFDNSYLTLPEVFYQIVVPENFKNPEVFLFNEKLSDELDINLKDPQDLCLFVFDDKTKTKRFAQAYSGHQFGYFTNLGDGRAVIIGEHITGSGDRFDIQLKGGGRTRYSRGGDGRATLRSMLREYLISEAMHYLDIPSSRSLAVIKTGEKVNRDTIQDGGAILRVMRSHLRVGTFEYAANTGDIENLRELTKYAINRLYPDIKDEDNYALSLLKRVMKEQIKLVSGWMRIGFIHGVMNTDNTSISGETFDYGPCAFMNIYNKDTVYSSIDRNKRYSYGNQPQIIKWNMVRFAESLLPLIDDNEEKALKLAQDAIDEFDEIWRKEYYSAMLKKIGIEKGTPELYSLVEGLLSLMDELNLDYTNTFLGLSGDIEEINAPIKSSVFKDWKNKWGNIIKDSGGLESAKELMRNNNPVYIPRNHTLERALDEAVSGDITLFNKFLEIFSEPYKYREDESDFLHPPDPGFEKGYRTFCGT